MTPTQISYDTSDMEFWMRNFTTATDGEIRHNLRALMVMGRCTETVAEQALRIVADRRNLTPFTLAEAMNYLEVR
jgi:hypothetical protein